MNDFLIDNGVEYSYEDLLKYINNSEGYFQAYQTNSLFQFFSNLIFGLVNDKPLVLIDSDLKTNELKDIDEELINKIEKFSSIKIIDVNQLIDSLLNSKSEISIFTSGTTGQPKKIIHTIQNLTRSIRKSDKYNDFVWAFAYNPTHMAGLQVFFQALANKNKLVNVFNYQRNDVYEYIEKYKITHMSATPTFYRLLLPVEKSFNYVQRVTYGGEKSDKNLYDSIKRIFPNAKMNNIYASTEAASLFAAKGEYFQIPFEIKDKFKVVENELLIHYSLLGKSESLIIIDGFYHSGDLIEWIDEDKGLFKFKSRKNELINVGGYKVNPGEIENVLLSIKGIQNALVYGKANSVLGNILCADIKLENRDSISEIEIKKYLSDKLQDFKIPRRIKFIEEFDLTRTGKIKRL